MTFSSGVKLGAYEVVGPLGAGGMGEVYRARDSKLKREVAIKVLPDGFSRDAERVSRFQREAEVLASLNHPHIAAIYDLANFDESRFLVLELVEGETLADRIARGPISIDESLPIANQIASALEAAHEKGIIHRDLKPANIKVRPDGMVKVLDFGLAKVFEETSLADDLRESPTMVNSVPSSEGVILGTAAYMSPEQARGKPVDKRTDIWAFGCVLYEMLSGRKPFDGETLTDVVAAVVKNEPDWKALPPATPVIIRSLLGRCLRKDPGQRLHDIADARIEIQEAISGSAIVPPAGVTAGVTEVRRGRRLVRALPWALAAAMAILLLILIFRPQREVLPNPAVIRLELNLPAGVEPYTATTRGALLSPDGTRVAFVGVLGGVRQLYVRRLDQFEAVPVRGTEMATTAFFSPDSREVGVVLSNRTLKKVSLVDGQAVTLARDVDLTAGAAWGADHRITFGRAGTLWQLPANGGSPQQLTTLDKGKHEILQAWPTVVAGGKTILFTSVTGSGRDDANIESLSIATGERRVIIESGSFPLYAPSGHLIFFRDGALLAAPFDLDRLEPTGPAVRVLEKLAVDSLGWPLVDISNSGSLLYSPSGTTGRLVWVSRQGVEDPINDTPQNYANPRVALDGRRVVVQAAGDLWIQDAARVTSTRLTSADTTGNSYPVWTPDGKRVVFRTRTGMHFADADGSGRSKSIPGTSRVDYPASFSPDNETLAFIRITADTSGDVYLLSLGDKPEAHPLVNTTNYEGGATVSPDGRWMAYASDESGQMQVYVRPFPGPDRKLPVSTNGGTSPSWNPRGRELFYRNGNKMMVVDVSASPELVLSAPRVLFEQRYAFGSNSTLANYDVSPDGLRFVMVKDESGSGKLNVVFNWFEELKRLVPAR